MTGASDAWGPAEVDRLRELANIGAGHAADAFAQLTGRPMWMAVPRVRPSEDPEPEGRATGVFFEVNGSLRALVGILFRPGECEEVVRCLGASRGGGDHASLLTEVGNILVSHMASAIADTLGGRLLPSLSSFSLDRAGEELADRVRRRGPGHPIRIECELTDGAGEIGGLLVLIPDSQGT
ncbi:MAG: chemotaxis protein CheC [Proteobacteria bacterium]|nr:chemotaxis protein CheC [Pseudomonadota bacterium]